MLIHILNQAPYYPSYKRIKGASTWLHKKPKLPKQIIYSITKWKMFTIFKFTVFNTLSWNLCIFCHQDSSDRNFILRVKIWRKMLIFPNLWLWIDPSRKWFLLAATNCTSRAPRKVTSCTSEKGLTSIFSRKEKNATKGYHATWNEPPGEYDRKMWIYVRWWRFFFISSAWESFDSK